MLLYDFLEENDASELIGCRVVFNNGRPPFIKGTIINVIVDNDMYVKFDDILNLESFNIKYNSTLFLLISEKYLMKNYLK